MAAWRSEGDLSSCCRRRLLLVLPLPRPGGAVAALCLLFGAKTRWFFHAEYLLSDTKQFLRERTLQASENYSSRRVIPGLVLAAMAD